MGLVIPGMEDLQVFAHSNTFNQGLGEIRPGQATVVIALDGSGDTDDIQEGLNMLPKTGGVVYIKEGTYTIDINITRAINNVSIIGAGKSTRIQTDANTSMIYCGGDHWTIRDLYLYGAGSGVGANKGINTSGSANVIVDGCYIENCGTVGIEISIGSDDIKITNNTIVNNFSAGITFNGTVVTSVIRAMIFNNYIAGNTWGIYTTFSDYCIIEGNIITGNSQDGIKLHTESNLNVVEGNQSYGNTGFGVNIGAATCDNNIVFDNICIADNISDSGTGTRISHNVTA